jgi:hypothetical protein
VEEVAADRGERKVEEPERRVEPGRRGGHGGDDAERGPRPRVRDERRVDRREPEERRQQADALEARGDGLGAGEEIRRGKDPSAPEEPHDLHGERREGDRVDAAERAEKRGRPAAYDFRISLAIVCSCMFVVPS